VASPTNNRTEGPRRAGYLVAILVSALGHVGLFVAVFFLAPLWLHSEDLTPPAYTVKIVDALPAGDLGSHLPRLARRTTEIKPSESPKEEPPVEEQKPPEQKPPADEDKNAIALNTKSLEATPTQTPTPTPEATPVPTVQATKAPAVQTAVPGTHPTPAPMTAKRHPKANPTPILMAKAEAKPTPSVQQRLNRLRAQLLAESLKRRSKDQEDEDSDDEDEDTDTAPPPTTGPAGAGPVVGSIPREGTGYGVGSGTGSEGMLQDPAFVLYYQAVQDKIKKAWSFMGGSSDLTATVDFSIGPDGALTGLKLAAGSKDSAFDDSVLRAIRRAAPFPAPPDKYRSEFMQGIEAQFALGDLRS
jgi:TonB family protein